MTKEKKPFIVNCRGRIDNGQHIDCDFQHIGFWGDTELFEHEREEKELDDRKTVFWKGFEKEDWWKVK